MQCAAPSAIVSRNKFHSSVFVKKYSVGTWTYELEQALALGSFGLGQFQEFLSNQYDGSWALRCMDGLCWLINAYWKV